MRAAGKNFLQSCGWRLGARLRGRTTTHASKIGGQKGLPIAKNHLKPFQEFSEQFSSFTHKMKGFGRNSHQKVLPNFAKTWEDKFLGIPCLAPIRRVLRTFQGGFWGRALRRVLRMGFTVKEGSEKWFLEGGCQRVPRTNPPECFLSPPCLSGMSRCFFVPHKSGVV